MNFTRNIKEQLFRHLRPKSKTTNYARTCLSGGARQAEANNCRDISAEPRKDELELDAITAAELAAIETNIALRKHRNNVPLLRTLLAELRGGSSSKEAASDTRRRIRAELDSLPNTTHPRLRSYGDAPVELKRFGTTLQRQDNKQPAQEFSQLCKRLNMFRMDHLGNYTGHKSYYLMGPLAVLEQALVRYALAALRQNEFQLMSVPDILPSAVIEGCGMQTEGDRTQVYKLDSGQCLSGTSEMALAGFFAGRVFEEHDLPIKVAAVSRCFRAETSGLHEEKGIYRVHQFTKVEMFAICLEEQSEDMLESFKEIEISLFQKLELDFRLLDMPPADLGAPAYQKYDIEAWMPGRKMWGEISSCSNCTDYQAKRLNIKYRTKDNQLKFVHTVNGTAAAIPRLLISIIESNQNENDSISIPTALNRFIKINEIKKDRNIPEIKLVKFIKPSEPSEVGT